MTNQKGSVPPTIGLNRDLFSPFFLCSILLFSLYWTWMFLLYWSDALNAPMQTNEHVLLLSRGAIAFGAALALLIMAAIHKWKSVEIPPAITCFTTAITMSAVPILTIVSTSGIFLSTPLVILGWFISGVGSAFMLMQIGKMLSYYRTESAPALQFIALILAVTLCLLILQQPTFIEETMILFVAVAGAAIGWCCTRLQKEDLEVSKPVPTAEASLNSQSKKEAEDRSGNPTSNQLTPPLRKITLIANLQMFLYSIMFGLCLGAGAVITPGLAASNFVWISFTLAGIALMVYIMWLNRYVQYNWMLYSLFVFAGIGIVPLSQLSLESPLRYALCLLLCFGFTTFDLIELWRLSRFAVLWNISFTRFFAVGRAINALGLCIGFALVYASISTTSASLDLIWETLIPGAVLLTLGITIVISIKDNLLGMTIEYEEPAQQETKKTRTQRAWKTACETLCQEYELSPREIEVFRLMARGRDAGYICESLFISNHTVKSHIYHIYQKLDIHSQQQLITMAEERARSLSSDSE